MCYHCTHDLRGSHRQRVNSCVACVSKSKVFIFHSFSNDPPTSPKSNPLKSKIRTIIDRISISPGKIGNYDCHSSIRLTNEPIWASSRSARFQLVLNELVTSWLISARSPYGLARLARTSLKFFVFYCFFIEIVIF